MLSFIVSSLQKGGPVNRLTLAASLLLNAATGLTAASGSSCDDVNRQAIELSAEQRVGEAEAQLSQFVSQIGDSADNQVCKGLTLFNLSFVLTRLGKLDAAEQAATRSVNLLEQKLGPNDVSLRKPLLLLVQLAIDQGKLSHASAVLSRAQSIPGTVPADVAVSEGLRATLLVETGKRVEAEAAYRRSIAARELAGGGATLAIVPELSNLAILFANDGRLPEALALLKRAQRIVETPPFDEARRIKTLLTLAVVESRLKHRKEAEGCFRRAMDLLDGVPLALRPEIGRRVYRQYSLFLRSVGRVHKAEALTQEASVRFGADWSLLTVSVDGLVAEQQLAVATHQAGKLPSK